ncbi:MAG: glutamate--cysteine ligase [Enterobacteriaceae bacterium]
MIFIGKNLKKYDFISLLEENPIMLKNIKRGLERETLRIKNNGELSDNPYPKPFGSSLTNKLITTDFSESSLEFITPVSKSVEKMIYMLKDIHIYVSKNLVNESLWFMSMPCVIRNEKNIQIANYGNSNIGKVKTLYRYGLKNRYGVLMQMISGMHYNFSFNRNFWNIYYKNKRIKKKKDLINKGYFQLIRNYYLFGWIIPYFFGASPGVHKFYLNNRNININFHKEKDLRYLKYSTSLRLSNIGYNSDIQNSLNINFNSLKDYVFSLKKALNTSYKKYEKLKGEKYINYYQINSNFLQIENELYTLIRPKRNLEINEFLSDVLIKKGVEYVEIRSIDINPFEPIGVTKNQIFFLDIFLVWCAIKYAPKIKNNDFIEVNKNWNKIILNGRNPKLSICLNNKSTTKSFKEIVSKLFIDFYRIANIFDYNNKNENYKNACNEMYKIVDDPKKTLSYKILNLIKKYGIYEYGIKISKNYLNKLNKEKLNFLNLNYFRKESYNSLKKQYFLEQNDKLVFKNFLNRYINRVKYGKNKTF